MTRFALSRRTLLRGAGVSIALPVLDAMLDGRGRAQAAGQPLPTCFVTFFTPNGIYSSKGWWPAESGTNGYTAPPWMAPLAPHRNDFTLLSGTRKAETYIGQSINNDAHILGHGTFATGVGITRSGAGGISVDQIVANNYGTATKFRSLPVALGNLGDPRNGNISWAGPNQPVPAERDPQVLFRRLFGNVAGGDLAKHRKSVLDLVKSDVTSLAPKLGVEDRQRLDQHLGALRDLENQIEKDKTALATCATPAMPGTTAALSNERGQTLMRLMVIALACDLTRVASFQLRSRQDNCVFSWLGLTESHHTISHLYDDAGVAKRYKIWVDEIEQLAFLLQLMKATPQAGGGTLLDRSVVFFANENGSVDDKADVHNCSNMPVILAGRGNGRLKAGQHVRVPNTPYSNVFVTLLGDVFDIPTAEFGAYGKGRIPDLTG